MIDAPNSPLSHRLTRLMIRVQLLTLAAFFGLILVPIFVIPTVSGARNIHPPDPSVISAIEASLTLTRDGELQFNESAALQRIVEKHPRFWFMAVTADGGHEVSFGQIPQEALSLRGGLKDVVSLQVMLELDTGSPTLLVRTVTLPGGTVKIALGGGPTLGIPEIIQTITLTLMVTTFIVLAVASAIAIPRFIRQEMKGLNAAAEAAGGIDANQRGTRIPETGVPAEVLTLVRAVNDALERLDDAHSRRERFLADAAHELRTPIAILSARIETADPFPGQEKLLRDVSRLGELTNQLLDVQRLTISKPELVPVDIVELGTGIVAALAPLAIAAGYELELDAPNEAVLVKGDKGSLIRAISNLVRNAINHGGNRGHIVVSVHAPGILSVADDGPGIRPGEEQRIFEPFHRSTPSSEGAGLGLSLVESIVRHHGATITVDRSASGGARFTITFPAIEEVGNVGAMLEG